MSTPLTGPFAGDAETCYYCKLSHPSVEAGGVWYCPNVLCSGCGAQGWRRQHLASYREGPTNYTVDAEELVEKAKAWVDEMPYKERALIEATLAMIPHWTPQPRAQP